MSLRHGRSSRSVAVSVGSLDKLRSRRIATRHGETAPCVALRFDGHFQFLPLCYRDARRACSIAGLILVPFRRVDAREGMAVLTLVQGVGVHEHHVFGITVRRVEVLCKTRFPVGLGPSVARPRAPLMRAYACYISVAGRGRWWRREWRRGWCTSGVGDRSRAPPPSQDRAKGDGWRGVGEHSKSCPVGRGAPRRRAGHTAGNARPATLGRRQRLGGDRRHR